MVLTFENKIKPFLSSFTTRNVATAEILGISDTWTTLASLSRAREHHASAVVNGKLYVFGGYSSSAGRMDLVEVYSPASNTWASAADLPLPIDEVVAVAL